MDIEDHHVESAEPSLVRPYSLTAGRTRPKVELALEALVAAQPVAMERQFELTNIETSIVELCRESPSVAEVAARLGIPIGVARVLVADLIDAGHVRVSATLKEDSSDDERRELIERVLSGLRRI